VRRYKLPDDFDDVVSALRGPIARALLIVCAHALPRGNDIASQIVSVVRAEELHRIIDECAAEAISAFGGEGMTSADREWVVNNASDSLHQLEMAIRRIVALHACGERHAGIEAAMPLMRGTE